MFNRFKGELAELLALDQDLALAKRLSREGSLPYRFRLYWGDVVKERRVSTSRSRWGNFTKGADGLLGTLSPIERANRIGWLSVHGLVEVKSIVFAIAKVMNQIDHHIERLSGGSKLSDQEFLPDALVIDAHRLIRIIGFLSHWKLSREWERTALGKSLVFPFPVGPLQETIMDQKHLGVWKIS
jgi:hypothetical protein